MKFEKINFREEAWRLTLDIDRSGRVTPWGLNDYSSQIQFARVYRYLIDGINWFYLRTIIDGDSHFSCDVGQNITSQGLEFLKGNPAEYLRSDVRYLLMMLGCLANHDYAKHVSLAKFISADIKSFSGGSKTYDNILNYYCDAILLKSVDVSLDSILAKNIFSYPLILPSKALLKAVSTGNVKVIEKSLNLEIKKYSEHCLKAGVLKDFDGEFAFDCMNNNVQHYWMWPQSVLLKILFPLDLKVSVSSELIPSILVG